MTDQKKNFDPKKPLIVNCSEIIGLEDYIGSFSFKRLNLKEKISAAAKSVELKHGAELDNIYENVAFILGQFEYACTSKAGSIEFEDMEIESLFEIYAKYSEWVESFREKFRTKQEENSKAGSN